MSLNLTFVGMRSPTAWALDLVCKAIGRTVGSSPSLESVLQRVSSPTRRRRWRASRSTQEASCGGPPGLLGNLEVTRKKLSSSEGAGGHRCGEGGAPQHRGCGRSCTVAALIAKRNMAPWRLGSAAQQRRCALCQQGMAAHFLNFFTKIMLG